MLSYFERKSHRRVWWKNATRCRWPFGIIQNGLGDRNFIKSKQDSLCLGRLLPPSDRQRPDPSVMKTHHRAVSKCILWKKSKTYKKSAKKDWHLREILSKKSEFRLNLKNLQAWHHLQCWYASIAITPHQRYLLALFHFTHLEMGMFFFLLVLCLSSALCLVIVSCHVEKLSSTFFALIFNNTYSLQIKKVLRTSFDETEQAQMTKGIVCQPGTMERNLDAICGT